MAHTLLVAILFPLLSTASVWNFPAPTDPATDQANLNGWTPRPTSVPDAKQLFKRQSFPTSTCGYISGSQAEPVSCSPGYCGFDNDLNAAACCSTYFLASNGVYSLTGCFFYTICYESSRLSQCDSACQTDSYALKCSDANYPGCYQFSYTDIHYSAYKCWTADGAEDVARSYVIAAATSPSSAVATSGIATSSSASGNNVISLGPTTLSSSASGSPATSSSAPPAANTPPTSSSSGHSSTTGSAASSSQTTTPPQAKSSSSNVGAIAGGVIGGVVGLALIAGLIIFFFLRRRRSENDGGHGGSNPQSTPEMFHQHPPPASGPGGAAAVVPHRYEKDAGPQYGRQELPANQQAATALPYQNRPMSEMDAGRSTSAVSPQSARPTSSILGTAADHSTSSQAPQELHSNNVGYGGQGADHHGAQYGAVPGFYGPGADSFDGPRSELPG